MIAGNVIEGARRAGVKKLLFLGSSWVSIRGRHQAADGGRRASRPGRSSPPISGMRSPRSPASNCARPIAGNGAATSSRPSRPISTAPATPTTSMRAASILALILKTHRAKEPMRAPEVEIRGNRSAAARVPACRRSGRRAGPSDAGVIGLLSPYRCRTLIWLCRAYLMSPTAFVTHQHGHTTRALLTAFGSQRQTRAGTAPARNRARSQ